TQLPGSTHDEKHLDDSSARSESITGTGTHYRPNRDYGSLSLAEAPSTRAQASSSWRRQARTARSSA
ncbi:MAG TPA: hypothetical protein VK899_05830, partial [Gemmatimonadales bacterium]|nr:hypothetical protein [Gemmatimonadales bacterium]